MVVKCCIKRLSSDVLFYATQRFCLVIDQRVQTRITVNLKVQIKSLHNFQSLPLFFLFRWSHLRIIFFDAHASLQSILFTHSVTLSFLNEPGTLPCLLLFLAHCTWRYTLYSLLRHPLAVKDSGHSLIFTNTRFREPDAFPCFPARFCWSGCEDLVASKIWIL